MTPPDPNLAQAWVDSRRVAVWSVDVTTPTAAALEVLNWQLQSLGNGLADLAQGLQKCWQAIGDNLAAIRADLQDLKAQQMKAQLAATGLTRREAPLHGSGGGASANGRLFVP
jgi:hypothetical protein